MGHQWSTRPPPQSYWQWRFVLCEKWGWWDGRHLWISWSLPIVTVGRPCGSIIRNMQNNFQMTLYFVNSTFFCGAKTCSPPPPFGRPVGNDAHNLCFATFKLVRNRNVKKSFLRCKKYKSGEFKMTHQATSNRSSLYSLIVSVVRHILFTLPWRNVFVFRTYGRTDIMCEIMTTIWPWPGGSTS